MAMWDFKVCLVSSIRRPSYQVLLKFAINFIRPYIGRPRRPAHKTGHTVYLRNLSVLQILTYTNTHTLCAVSQNRRVPRILLFLFRSTGCDTCFGKRQCQNVAARWFKLLLATNPSGQWRIKSNGSWRSGTSVYENGTDGN